MQTPQTVETSNQELDAGLSFCEVTTTHLLHQPGNQWISRCWFHHLEIKEPDLERQEGEAARQVLQKGATHTTVERQRQTHVRGCMAALCGPAC